MLMHLFIISGHLQVPDPMNHRKCNFYVSPRGKIKSFLQTAPPVCRIHESGFLFLSQRMKYKIHIQSVVQEASVLIRHVQK